MKLRTSFFNTTVLRKDITRYAPVWGLYTVGLFLFLLIPSLGRSADSVARDLCQTPLSALHLIYGGICALMVFGDLFKARLCYATHALPLRREGWFLTHFTAGMLFSFVPHLFIGLCLLPILQNHWYMAFLWLALCTLQYFFFFSVGAFCAVCAGNRLGTVAAYLILNFGILLVDAYADSIYTPLLYGIEYNWDSIYWLIPVSALSNLDFFSYENKPFQLLSFCGEDWLYLGIIAAVGIVLAVLAVLIYRKRNLESAGDFLSLKAAKPVFLLVYTLSVAYILNLIVAPMLLGMFVGLFVGFFTGSMLLERTVKVFRGWNFLKFGILTTVLFLSIGLTALDPIGLTRYVPDTEDVKSLTFYKNDDRYEENHWSTSDPELIDDFRQFHQEMTDRSYAFAEGPFITVYLQYELQSGRTVLREYPVLVDSAPGQFVRQASSNWQYVFKTDDWDSFVASIEKITVELFSEPTLSDPAEVRGLLEAMKADCEAGNMAQYSILHQEEETVCYVHIHDPEYRHSPNYDYYMKVYSFNLDIYSSCEHTIAYLESYGLNMSALVS